MKKRILAMVFAIVAVASLSLSASAAERKVLSYYFYLYESNETDQTGCFDTIYGYQPKATSYIPAAIRLDTNTSKYQIRTTINYSNTIRATDFTWQSAGSRAMPNYINTAYAKAGQTFKLWVRRNASESAASIYIDGSWSPDHK